MVPSILVCINFISHWKKQCEVQVINHPVSTEMPKGHFGIAASIFIRAPPVTSTNVAMFTR